MVIAYHKKLIHEYAELSFIKNVFQSYHRRINYCTCISKHLLNIVNAVCKKFGNLKEKKNTKAHTNTTHVSNHIWMAIRATYGKD